MSQDEDNVIAIHCKGGKGRTGTCVSAWLIESGHFTKAKVCPDNLQNIEFLPEVTHPTDAFVPYQDTNCITLFIYNNSW